jgi:hypothetical protein
MDVVRHANPELALSALEFWQRFIILDGVTLNEKFKKKLFDQ